MSDSVAALKALKLDISGDFNGFVRLMGKYESHLRTLNTLTLTGQTGDVSIHNTNISITKEVIRLRCMAVNETIERFRKLFRSISGAGLDTSSRLQFDELHITCKNLLDAFEIESSRVEGLTTY